MIKINGKIKKMVLYNKTFLLLISLLYLNSLTSAMSLVNYCKTDSDCPPKWDKNAIFCSTPFLNQNEVNRRSENDIVVYDGSEVVNVDPDKPETLSQSEYSPVCLPYRPVGYKCEKRLDCLANDDVDLPYIQCINGACADLGKTTGNYMKTAQGNHKKGSKYWYIGLGLGIVTVILFIGCSTLMVIGKNKKIEKQNMEEKIKRENEKDINAYEEDKTTVTIINENDYDDGYNNNDKSDDGVTVIDTETSYVSKIQNKESKKISSNDKDKKKEKNKRSLLNILTFGLLGNSSNLSDNQLNTDENVDNDATLGRHKTHGIKMNKKNMDNEVDLTDTDSLREKNINISDSLDYEKLKLHKEVLRKSSKQVLKHKSSIDPERTLVRNLHKKSSKATVGTLTTMDTLKTLASAKSIPQSEKSTIISTIVEDNPQKSKQFDDSTYSNYNFIRQSSIIGNIDINEDDDDNNELSFDNYKMCSLNRQKTLYDDNSNEQENIYSDTSSEKNINRAMLKRFSDRVSNQNDYYNSLIHSSSSDALKINKTNLSMNNIDNKYKNRQKNTYPTPKQNPNSNLQFKNKENQNDNIETFNTPLPSPEISNIMNNNSNNSYNNNNGNISDYYYQNDQEDLDIHLTLPSFHRIPISEIVESTFASSNSSSDNSSINANEIINDNQMNSKIKNGKENIRNDSEGINSSYLKNYAIPTPYDSPREHIQQKSDFKPFENQYSNKIVNRNNMKAYTPKLRENHALSSTILNQSNICYVQSTQNIPFQSQMKTYSQPQFNNNNNNYNDNRNNNANSTFNHYSSNNPFENMTSNQHHNKILQSVNTSNSMIQNTESLNRNTVNYEYSNNSPLNNQNSKYYH